MASVILGQDNPLSGELSVFLPNQELRKAVLCIIATLATTAKDRIEISCDTRIAAEPGYDPDRPFALYEDESGNRIRNPLTDTEFLTVQALEQIETLCNQAITW
jgi:hypothetical protein